MNKKIKTLLPFALYEELQNMDQLDPKEMKDFLLTLRRYCDSSGKDYGKICKELEIEEPKDEMTSFGTKRSSWFQDLFDKTRRYLEEDED